MTPESVSQASLWQFTAAVAGWKATHGGEEAGLSQQDEDDLWQGIKERMH